MLQLQRVVDKLQYTTTLFLHGHFSRLNSLQHVVYSTYSKCSCANYSFHFFSVHARISEAPDMKLKHVLKFMTGSDQIPPLGFPSLIKIHFLQGCNPGRKCRPTSSTCFLTLSLPVHTCNSDELGELLISAVNDCCGFVEV